MRAGRAAADLGTGWFQRASHAVMCSQDEPARAQEPNELRLPTSERLLDIAAALFWSKGYAATTTREIAAVLGIRKASLYHHVRRKEDLLYEICVASLEYIRQAVESAVSAVDDPLERARVLIRAHARVETGLGGRCNDASLKGQICIRLGSVPYLTICYRTAYLRLR